MIEDPVARSPRGRHFLPRFVPAQSSVGNGSLPATHQPPQRVARAVYTSAGPKPKLLDQVWQAIYTRHYSYRTEKAYVSWIKRFIFFHNKRHPAEMGEAEIAAFLSSLATESRVSASTQNQALNALLFLYREVLHKEVGYVSDVVRAKRPVSGCLKRLLSR